MAKKAYPIFHQVADGLASQLPTGCLTCPGCQPSVESGRSLLRYDVMGGGEYRVRYSVRCENGAGTCPEKLNSWRTLSREIEAPIEEVRELAKTYGPFSKEDAIDLLKEHMQKEAKAREKKMSPLKGRTATAIIMDEVAEMRPEIWESVGADILRRKDAFKMLMGSFEVDSPPEPEPEPEPSKNEPVNTSEEVGLFS